MVFRLINLKKKKTLFLIGILGSVLKDQKVSLSIFFYSTRCHQHNIFTKKAVGKTRIISVQEIHLRLYDEFGQGIILEQLFKPSFEFIPKITLRPATVQSCLNNLTPRGKLDQKPFLLLCLFCGA